MDSAAIPWGKHHVVVHTPEPSSGAARYVFELVKGLAATGVPVVLFCPSNFEYLNQMRTFGVAVVTTGDRGFESAGLRSRILRNSRFVLQALWRQAHAIPSGDIVHFQFPIYFPFGLPFFALAALKDCPIVFTAHDPLPHSWLWPGRFRSFERKMLGLAYRFSSRVIVHNEAGRRTLIREFGLDPGKLAVIEHGPFVSAGCTSGFPSFDELRLLVFGSIRANKGIHLAIQAVQRLNTRPGVPVRLTIAGRVANAREESYWSQCQALIQTNPRGIYVQNGYISEDAVGPLVGEHHALLLPYLAFSSESGVAALALSNRRPILATRVGGFETLLASCSCGIAIDTPTVEGVADAIDKARNAGRDMLERLGSQGEVFISSSRSWSDISKDTLALYAEVLTAGRATGTPPAKVHVYRGEAGR